MPSAGPSRLRAPSFEKLPGLDHGFGTRLWNGDTEKIFQVDQIHGDRIVVVTAGDTVPEVRRGKGDALVTTVRGVRIGIRTADCLPILIYAPDSGVVAAVHAGWRGTEERIAAKVVGYLRHEFGADPSSSIVALGPCIEGDCYEIGSEVGSRFSHRFKEAPFFLKPGRPGRFQLDIVLANRLILEGEGVDPRKIWSAGLCTYCRPDLFHSYRRDQNKTGRLLSWIGLRP